MACTSALGTAAAEDVVVSFPVHLTDVLTSNSCSNSLITNTATLDADYLVAALPQISEETDVTAKHLAMQKSADPSSAMPGDAITYTLDFQVDDTEDLNSLVVTDTLPDGTSFDEHISLTVNGGGLVIVPAVTANPDGTTTIVYDIGAVVPGTINGGTSISIIYSASINQDYVDSGAPVEAGDALPNTISASYSTLAGASDCNEGSGAVVNITPVEVSKQIVNPQPFYVPGETVTFRLTLTIPSGDTRNIRVADAFPLPVFDVNDISTTWLDDIRLGPDDTTGLVPDNIFVFANLNALAVDFPDISSTTTQILQVDIDATVTDDPFADKLFLTNIATIRTENSDGVVSDSEAIAQLTVGAPRLVITKGVSASTNTGSSIDPSPATAPVDGNLTNGDAGDTITYVITVENIGSASAYDVLISDSAPSGLTACTLVTVQDGAANNLSYTGDLFTAGLVLDNPLAANDNNPAGGGSPYSTDTALLTVNCDIATGVNPGGLIENTAAAEWASLSDAEVFPRVEDTASVLISNAVASKLFVSSSETSTSDTANPPRATIGEVVRYRLVLEIPEGTIPDLNLVDTLPAGLAFIDAGNDDQTRAAFISNGAGITSTAVAIPNINGNSAALVDVPSSAITFDLTATTPTFSLGNVVNTDNDDDAEFLVVEFNALVLNVAAGGNDAGDNLNNSFVARQGSTQTGQFQFGPGQGGRTPGRRGQNRQPTAG